ncbi:hypothetical protein HYPSUDRAFT_66691 [Hypholoma sublateritium FD-334 SS-4]|uniref:Initiator tRNA phosphoribosyl transferase n=1 Tax=Hypholoma sublateritium (strain FD-334 SS-4) TaxID=945553 RepID=A0A0D2P2I8_HYPSF|nr:hypothetical protein HYPSUDRAFT_66691 [Hypholoma sublateritium FD-334 SS-4]
MNLNSIDEPRSEDVLSYIRKESLDVYNRLHSIEEDVAFVDQVHKSYPSTPLLPNLRCGAWYTDPAVATPVPAYFKSTDGHNNNWSFNLRRANLHLLPLIIKRQSIILVDSTRSGKKIPDALSKTIPIWCSVINRAMLLRHLSLKEERGVDWNVALYTPPSTVSRQEHHQIEQRLDNWARDLANSSFNLPLLPSPLRPVWITPSTSTFPTFSPKESEPPKFFPVICVSASKQVRQGVERRTGGFSYIQGSGDDHELWGMGLTPEMFWAHRTRLRAAGRTDIPTLVAEIVGSENNASAIQNPPSPVLHVEGRLLLAAINEIPQSPQDANIRYIILTPSSEESQTVDDTHVYIPTVSGKKGQSHFLQTILPLSMEAINQALQGGKNVCVACESGKDMSVGVVLTALQLYFGGDGLYISSNSAYSADKRSIRTRLEWIIESRPQANPSRTVLKRVNEFLLTPSTFRGVPSLPGP